MRQTFSTNLEVLYKQYTEMLKANRVDLAIACAKAYNRELKRTGGPLDDLLSMGL